MNAAILDLGVFAVYLAIAAVTIFVRILRKPPEPPEMKDWLGSNPL